MNLTEHLGKLNKPLLVGIGIGLLVLAGIADMLSGPHFNSSLLYLIPVSFFSWYIGCKAGLVTAAVSAVIRLLLHRVGLLSHAPSGIAYVNSAAWLALYIFLVLMIAELRHLYHRERISSRIDPLTNIPNRRALYEALGAEKNRALRYHLPLTLAYIDIDHFKDVNDQFGHSTGDEVLAVVADTMHNNVRQFDTVARLGGDEFAVLLPDASEDAAAVALRKLHSLLDAAMREKDWPVTFSIGAVSFPPPPLSVDEMISKADQVMYEAKTRGRNQIIARSAA